MIHCNSGTKTIRGWYIASLVGIIAATVMGVSPLYRVGTLLLINSVFLTIERALSPQRLIGK